MKKILNGSYIEHGKRNRVTCTITDERGYISITGEVTPYRCRTPHICGCVHDYIAKAFPQLRPWLSLHLTNADGSQSWWYENALYHLANNDTDAAQACLKCTDAEIRELDALVRYGLHKEHHSWGYNVEGQGKELFAKAVANMGIQERNKQAYDNFLAFCETL